jgi:hypothetical protein
VREEKKRGRPWVRRRGGGECGRRRGDKKEGKKKWKTEMLGIG